jgi:arabinofuranan 3-O-arabinosyltransferase
MTLGFAALAFVVALSQRPGWAHTDTKIDLHVDPSRFLADAASTWTQTTDLGDVHSAQYGGYLWPMGPFYALLRELGIAPWLVQRLWLGLLLALAAWGMLRLLDVLVGRPRGVAHLVATAFFVLNPYTVFCTARATSALIAYAALPWLLIVVHRGVRAVRGLRGWRGWWWAAAFALILTSTGAGINAAVVGWMLVGPLLLLIYEPVTGAVRWRDAGGFLLRMGIFGVLASLWWVMPLLVHVRYGIDFLQFTEQPRSIWGTNSISETLRLMGYWTSYLGYGFGPVRPLFDDSPTMLYDPLVVGASLLLPALAAAGFVWTRRFRYGPFLLLLVVVGVVIMAAGYPDGTPLREAMEWIYRKLWLVRFMRTTQKAAPLVAVGVAGLLGLAAQLAWARLRARPPSPARSTALIAAPAALAALIALAALPLVRGEALDGQLNWKRIPAAWTDAGRGLDRELPRNARALVLPGSIFAFYQWGGTVDAILPRLTDQPVAVRYETPLADLHSADVLVTVDSLLQQRRLFPGQLPALLRMLGIRAVVSGTDDDLSRSGALDPHAAAVELAGQGLDSPSRSYGPSRRIVPDAGELGVPLTVPQVRRYDVPVGRGIVHVAPAGPATIVDGGAGGLANLAAFGALPERRPILYAGDLSGPALRKEAARGAEVVVTDSNRRRAFLPEFTSQSVGPTLSADDAVDENAAVMNPFPERGSDAQTVAALQGADYLRAPSQSSSNQFPEQAPIAALDGDLSTSWVADRLARDESWWLELGFTRPRAVPYVDVYPLSGEHGVVEAVEVNGVRAEVGRGWTRIPLRQRGVERVRVRIAEVDQPEVGLGSGGGLRELRVPGVRVRQLLRPPIVSGRALAGRDLRSVGLTYLFERTTGDRPFMRDRYTADPTIGRVADIGDPERHIDRGVFAPAARSYAVDAWVNPALHAPDSAFDRLVGVPAGTVFESSSRFHDLPRHRASSAFDGRAGSAWIGLWIRPDAPLPWISWTSPRPLAVSRLRLTPPKDAAVRRPTRVRLSWSGGASPPLPVAADGTVTLPRPARARSFRLTILDARFPPGASEAERVMRAVGIASLRVPGVRPAAVPRRGPLRPACGHVRIEVADRVVPLRAEGTIAELDAGRPLRARSCAGEVRMGGGLQRIRSLSGAFSVDLLRLRSPAPAPVAASGGGMVVDPGRIGRSSVDGVEVRLDGPSWLALGQSFNKGWRAECDGRSLGAPIPLEAYGNGWRAPTSCRFVDFSFAPQQGVRVSYAVSAVVCVLLAAFLLLGRLLRPERRREPVPAPLPEPLVRPMPLTRALAISFVITVPLALIFAKRTGVVIGPVLTLVLWRGVGPRVLTAAAAGLLGIVVPLLYVLVGPRNQGGYAFAYSNSLISAHWVALGGVLLLALATWRTLAGARGRQPRPERPPPSGPPPDRGGEPHERDLELARGPAATG